MKLYLHMAYFANIKRGIKTTTKGLSLTLKHFWAARNTKGPLNVQDKDYFKISEGYVTLQYPHETISVPEIGRYQLDCEIDDCIVCDKCAKICPVDCIEIEAIKSPELIRTTSDGSPVRLHAAKFDIDLAKCCFCGLCTTVCPTECLTMNSEYDYSVTDVNLLNFAFSNLTKEEADEKRKLYDQFVAEKEAAKALEKPNVIESPAQSTGFKPKFPGGGGFKPNASPTITEEKEEEKPKFAPKFKADISNISEAKPKFTPKSKPTEIVDETADNQPKTFTPKIKASAEELNEPPKKAFIPKSKPQIVEPIGNEKSDLVKPGLPFKPKIKPEVSNQNIDQEISKVASLPFKPKMKPAISAESSPNETEKVINNNEVKKPSLPFKPKLKPESAENNKVSPEGGNTDGVGPIIEEVSKKFTPKLRPKA